MIALLRRFATRYPVLFGVGEAIGIGLTAIRAYKMRSALTILGVVMGIMTVTGMSSIVAGLNASMAAQIEALGTSAIFIRPFAPGEHVEGEWWRKRRGLTKAELEALVQRASLIRMVAPMEILAADLIKYENQKAQTDIVLGTTAAYEAVHEHYVERGRFISDLDVKRGAKVALLGADVADALFPFVDPIDKSISIDGRRFTVIGVMERKGKFLFRSRDNLILLPLEAFGKRDPRFNFFVADLKPVSTARIDDAVEQVRELLRRERKLRFWQPDNFGVFTQDTLTDLYRQITGGIYMVMITISCVGLLVGGVGVMNIMLVSVTERTREIGVRKALGAKKRDILWQFLTEAMTLTGVGGILGIAIGALLAWVVNALSPFPAVLQPVWVLLAFGVSVGVGWIFGLWPAMRAAGLDPIEALRYE
jgi:putative ABC transport system permease protein